MADITENPNPCLVKDLQLDYREDQSLDAHATSGADKQ